MSSTLTPGLEREGERAPRTSPAYLQSQFPLPPWKILDSLKKGPYKHFHPIHTVCLDRWSKHKETQCEEHNDLDPDE